MSMMVSFVLSFFPRDVLDEILNLIESVSEGFPSYSCMDSRGDKTTCILLYIRSSKMGKVIHFCMSVAWSFGV